MFHRITCPACQHKFTVPEAAMGHRQTCPNCQSLFQAGKSVPEAEVPMKLQPAAAAAGAVPHNKTLLAETEPQIKYNCPRCKKPLESPASEAGLKKPCPACGGRLQIPAAPRPAPQTNLNKTILATDETAAPASQQTLAAAPSSAKADAAVPAPARSPLSSPLVIAGVACGGVLLLGLLACVITMFFSGSAERDRIAKAQQEYETAKKELEDFKKSIQQNEALMAQKRQLEADHNKKWDDFMAQHLAKQKELDAAREKELAQLKDKEAIAKLEEKRRQERDALKKLEEETLAKKAKEDAEMKAEIARLKAQVDAANQAAQQRTVIVSQPPPPYYPPYHWRYYWGY
jgi:hypothetical protein